MRRNYRQNNRSYPRQDNGTVENMENVTNSDINIPSNIEDKPSAEQDKENTLNTAEVDLDDSVTITMNNKENNSVPDITNMDVSEITPETMSETISTVPETIIKTKSEIIPETISVKIAETTSETTSETIPEITANTMSDTTAGAMTEIMPDTTAGAMSDIMPDTTAGAMTEIMPDTTAEAITETIRDTIVEEDLELTMKEINEQKEDSLEIRGQEECLTDCDRDIIIIDKERYEILASEQSFVFHPEYFGISPTWTNDLNFQYKCLFELKDHQLYLKSFQVTSDRGYPIINNVKPEVCNLEQGLETVQYVNVNEPLKYSGAIMFANSLVKDYRSPYHMDLNNPLCFSFKFVGELIFEEGKLITSVNHNKAMRRIRKNIDLGLRSLDKKQDIKCIKKFIKVSFIGDYQYQEKKQKRIWKDTTKSRNGKNKEVHIMESGKKRYLGRIKKHIRIFGSK